MNVVAVCLYVACRQKGTRSLMLIDFSDLLQVQLFHMNIFFLSLSRAAWKMWSFTFAPQWHTSLSSS